MDILDPEYDIIGCETTEEQSNDEVRTSQVSERSEGKTDMMR